MALDSDPRVSYWNNNYLNYWKNKTHSDADSSNSETRAETDISSIFDSLISEHISGVVLDAVAATVVCFHYFYHFLIVSTV